MVVSRAAPARTVAKTSSARQKNLLITILLDNIRRQPRDANVRLSTYPGLPLKFAQEFFRCLKDLTGICKQGPQNAHLTAIFCSSRIFKYREYARRRKLKRDIEIPRDSSTPCHRLYTQARHRAGAHFHHVARGYL